MTRLAQKKGADHDRKQVFKTTWGGRPLQVEVGQLAKQANGAVLVRYGDTVVLRCSRCFKRSKRCKTSSPLTINYEEKMYAVGKVPGGFIKREGRPSTEATLTARLIDRPIRPMFADGFRNEVRDKHCHECGTRLLTSNGCNARLFFSVVYFRCAF